MVYPMNQNHSPLNLFIYLSEILGRTVVDSAGCRVGRLNDIAMRLSDEVYPRAVGFVVQRGNLLREFAHVDVEQVQTLNGVVKLKVEQSQIAFQKDKRKYDLTLNHDVLDQQIVDVDNQKVVRVNDIHLLKVDNQLYLAHVDFGVRGLVRRMGWDRGIDLLIRLFAANSPYLSREDFIPWRNAQLLTTGRYKNVLRLDVSRKKMANIPPIEIAEIMEDLDVFEKLHLFKSLDARVQHRVFADLATQEKRDLVDHLSDEEASDLLENIPADEATDLLMTLSKEQTFRLMRYMETQKSKELRLLLGYAKDSAGGLMTTEYLAVKKDASVRDALQLIKAKVDYPGSIYQLYIVDEYNRLVGSTSLRRLINEDPDRPIRETCYPKNVFVRTSDGMEEIALLMEKYKVPSVAVLSDDDVLQGVITSDDVMEALISLAWSKYKEKLT